MWQVAILLNSRDIEHFHHCGKFCVTVLIDHFSGPTGGLYASCPCRAQLCRVTGAGPQRRYTFARGQGRIQWEGKPQLLPGHLRPSVSNRQEEETFVMRWDRVAVNSMTEGGRGVSPKWLIFPEMKKCSKAAFRRTWCLGSCFSGSRTCVAPSGKLAGQQRWSLRVGVSKIRCGTWGCGSSYWLCAEFPLRGGSRI